MIRRYKGPKELVETGWPPRIVISMPIFESPFEIGFNHHYSIDSNIKECLADFFHQMIIEHPKAKIDSKKSILRISCVGDPTRDRDAEIRRP